MTLTDLDQVKALADPLRLRMLGAFAEERTTKQVAAVLGEKPTRLYHHVDALEKVGLIRMTRTRRNRGTLERYYRSVASAFRADPALFSPARTGAADDSVSPMIRSLMDQTTSEILTLIAEGQGKEGIDEEGLVCFLEIRGTAAEMRRLRERIRRLVEGVEEKDRAGHDRAKGAGRSRRARRYRLCLTFFPLDLPRAREEDPPRGRARPASQRSRGARGTPRR